MPTESQRNDVRVFCEAGAILAESPVWDAVRRELIWCDITTGLVHRTSEDGESDRASRLPPPVASFQRRLGGGLVVALSDRIVVTDDDGGSPSDLVVIPHRHEGIRFNEGKCDPFGNFVVGGMDLTSKDPDAGLYRVTPSGDVTELRGGFGTCNGMEWNDDGSVMWVTDTAVETIFRGGYGPEGLLTDLEPFAVGRQHDGLARDERGEFWGAVYGAGEVVHLSAEGEVLGMIDIPVPNVTGVAFGGSDLRTLFVCSAREHLTEEQLEEMPLSGSVFAVDLDRAGRPPHLFG